MRTEFGAGVEHCAKFHQIGLFSPAKTEVNFNRLLAFASCIQATHPPKLFILLKFDRNLRTDFTHQIVESKKTICLFESIRRASWRHHNRGVFP